MRTNPAHFFHSFRIGKQRPPAPVSRNPAGSFLHGCRVLLAMILLSAHASAEVVYVASDATDSAPDGTTWAKAFPTLNQGLAAAKENSEIWIKTGTYKPTTGTDRNAAFRLKSNVIIRGGFKGDEKVAQPRNPWAYPTVLSADIGIPMTGTVTALNPVPRAEPAADDAGWEDNSYNVFVGDGLTGVVLEYLTITGASATAASTEIPQVDIDGYELYSADPDVVGAQTNVRPSPKVAGGGIFFTAGATWNIEKYSLQALGCNFSRNRARGYGGAVGIFDASAYFDSCVFDRNRSEGTGGAFWGLNQQTAFLRCTFDKNYSAKGGGAVTLKSIPSFRAEDPSTENNNDKFRKGLETVAFGMAGVDNPPAETKADARDRISKTLTDYGIYKSSRNSSLTEIGLYEAVAENVSPSISQDVGTGVKVVKTAKEAYDTGKGVAATAVKIKKINGLTKEVPTNVYDVVKLGVAIGDMLVEILDRFGLVDHNNPHFKNWQTFSDNFNKYATKEGLIKLWLDDRLSRVDTVTPLMREVKKRNLKNYYTLAGRSAFASCSFTENMTESLGGAIELVFNNVLIESCTFTDNRAVTDGAAIASSVYNIPRIYSSVFSNNYSDQGASAITASLSSLMFVSNCTIINNKSFADDGVAFSALMGSDVRVFNTILWNNSNESISKGADIMVTTRATMSEKTRVKFDGLQDGQQANWVAMMDIRNSIIQSLKTIPLGEDKIGVNLTSFEPEAIAEAVKARDAADALGQLEGTGLVNAGSGVRPKLVDPAWGNSDEDPLLLSKPLGKQSRHSPANDAGENRWIDGGLTEHVVPTADLMDVAYGKRIMGSSSRVDIGAYERDPSAPLDDNVPLAANNDGIMASGPAASGVGGRTAPVIGANTPPGTAIYRVRPGATGTGSSWADAADLQTAINHPNAEIWVAAGTYKPGTTRTASFRMADGVRIFGGFFGNELQRGLRNWRDNPTVISGDIGVEGDFSDNSKNLFTNTGVTGSALIDGFTLRDAWSVDADGGAIFNTSSEPVISNCVFRNNHARNGGAVYSTGAVAVGSVITNCEFRDNTAEFAGGAVRYLHSLFAHNVIFSGNSAVTGGGAISVSGDGPTRYCTVQNGLFYNNTATGGPGGAIASVGTDPDVTTDGLYLNVQNSTFYGNTASAANPAQKAGGGAIYHVFASPAGVASAVFLNSIFYKNTATNAFTGSIETQEKRQILTPDEPLVSNCLIQGLDIYRGGYGNANIDGDPQFVAEGSNFRLRPWSLALDAGNAANFYTETLSVDLDGNKRSLNWAIDLGPYEGTDKVPQHPAPAVTQASAGTESFTITADYLSGAEDTLRWYVDRGDGLGYVVLTDVDGEVSGSRTASLTINSRPNGFSYRLHVLRNGWTYFSPLSKILPTADSISRYVYVKPVATGDGNGTSWADAMSDLQGAISRTGVEVWVAQGTYKPGITRDAHYSMAPGVKIYGGFIGNEMKLEKRDWKAMKTIISGAIGGAGREDNIRHLFLNTDISGIAILDGFHLRDAHADDQTDGGAMRNVNSNPTIRNCVFETNHARNGGAISSTDAVRSAFGPTLSNCEFIGNTAELAGGALNYTGSLSSHNLVFKNNSARTGGAVSVTGFADGQGCTLENSLLVGNRATNGPGGAVHVTGAIQRSTNCTFYGNQAVIDSPSAKAGGGALYLDHPTDGASLIILNSIFYKNTAVNNGTGGGSTVEKQQYITSAGSGISCRNTLIEGLDTYAIGSAGTNFDGDPMFLLEGTDFHVANGSLTIDAGAMPDNANFETSDLDGGERIINGTPDLGAYEHVATAASPLKTVVSSSSGLENHGYSVQYTALPGDQLQWYVDRGDGKGYVVLGDRDPGNEHLPVEYEGTTTASLRIYSPPSGYLFRLQLTRDSARYYSPVKRLVPTEISKGSYVYVRPTATGDGSGSGWINATSDLQEAMSRQNAQVWVQAGTYHPTKGTDRDASFSVTATGVKVYGGFKGTESLRDARNPVLNETKISGAIGGSGVEDNSRHLFRNENVKSSVVIDGLVFEDAHAENEDGGAMLNINARPTIQNCVFRNNTARNGGAISSSVTSGFGSDLVNCRFINNKATVAGGAVSYNSSLVSTNVIFKGNQAPVGGAVYMEGNSSGQVLTVRNGLFTGNRALDGNGGAIFTKGLGLWIGNSTFYGNRSQLSSASKLGGGAVYQDFTVSGLATVSAFNSIFYGNTSVNPGAGGLDTIERQQIGTRGNGGVSVAHSLVQGLNEYQNIATFANFDESPAFADAAGGDFRLSSLSPGINWGVTSFGGSYLLAEKDLDGNTRLQGGVVDLGPYESSSAAALGRVTSTSDYSANVFRVVKEANLTVQAGDVLQWYVDRGDGNWVLLSADGVYSGVGTTKLTISSPPSTADGYKFRLQVTRDGSVLATLPTQFSFPPERVYVNAARFNMSADGAGWATAYGDLGQAIKASGPGTSIWVAAGTYLPSAGSDTAAAFRIPGGVRIYGGFNVGATALTQRNPVLYPTILSGKLAGAATRYGYSRHVVVNQGGVDRSALLDGFILKDAYSSLVVNDAASPTLRNCVFQDNDSSQSGDGSGAAISNINGANPLIAECRFLRNTATYAGALYISGASATVENSLFSRNSSKACGGAIVVERGSLDMVNCTVVDNTTPGFAAGLYAVDGTVTIGNSIFWNNRTGYSGFSEYDQGIRSSGGTLAIGYSCIQGGTSLPETNTATNPLFDEPTATVEYALARYSPLVNAGSADHSISSPLDIGGRTRVFQGVPDMGVYELQTNVANLKVLLKSLPRPRVTYNIGGSVDFSITWNTSFDFNPRWKVVDKNNEAVPAARFAVNTVDGSSVLRVNNIGLPDDGFRISVTDELIEPGTGEIIKVYTPPVTLTVREPRIIRVNPLAAGKNDGSSWADAYVDLITAVDLAQPADEIWVAKGTYTAGDSTYFQLKSTVTLYGGFSGLGTETLRSQRDPVLNPTILHAVGIHPVIYGAPQESEYGMPSEVDGFIVENSVGPMVVCNIAASTNFRNCVFRNNAGYLYNVNSPIAFDRCEFSGNSGRLFLVIGSAVTFSDSRFLNNTTTADFISSSDAATVTFSDVRFTGNAIAGALIRNGNGPNGGAALNVFRSEFRGNSTGGAVIANGSTGTCRIESSLFVRNIATAGWATIQNGGKLNILASTFADNHGGYDGGALATYPESNVKINSSIFWGNRSSRPNATLEAQQLGSGAGLFEIKRSIVEGLATHTATALNNTAYYPVFADPATGDYHLLSNSPAVDTGEPNLVLASPLDLDKAPRPHPVIYMDAGAYEFQGTATQPLKISEFPASVVTAETSGTSFVVRAAAFYGYQWQYWDGTQWVNVTNTGYFRVVNSANSDTSTLNIDTPPLSLNGTKFRVKITAPGGVSHTTGDLVLTVTRPRVIYVNADTILPKASTDGSTWEKAYQTVQEALAVTNENCEIWVREGTYTFNSTANLKWNVHLYGGFAGNETERDQRDPAVNPVTLLANGKRIFSTSDPVDRKPGNAVLDGFTLSGSTSESALFLATSDAVIRNCVFRGNTRAIAVSGHSNPVIAGCVFDSHASTAVNLDGDSATISGCSFVNNRDSSGNASGAIVYVFRGNVKISDSTFTGNTSSGGVIVAYGNYDATSAANLVAGKLTRLDMSRCTMTGNSAYAGILATQALLNLDNSLLAKNTLYATAVRGFSRCQFNLTNVVIAHNIGELESVAINCDANVDLKNSIVWGNRTSWPYGPIIRPGSPSLVEDSQIKRNSWTFISNSIVEGAYAISGNGNSGYDPLFADAAAMDYQIPAMSPAVNGGTATGILAGTLDLASQPRVHDTAPDIGAYEFTGVAQTPIRMNSNLDNRTVIVGLDARYAVQTAAGVNVRWQVRSGGSFVDFVPGVNQTLSEDGKVMTLSRLTLAMSGSEFRFVLSGDVSYTSAPGVLTVVPKPLVFVNAGATGDNNGTSWENAHTSVNAAINGASDIFTGGPREIWVAQGTYTTDTSLAPGVELIGGFVGNETERGQRDVSAHPTILTRTVDISSAGGSDMLSNSNPDPKTLGIVIDGFTLTGMTGGVTVRNAPALIRNCTFSQLAGYGLINVSGPMTVEDCVFDQSGNYSIVAGPWSTTIIRRSTFQGGKSGGVASGYESTLSIEDSVFRDNAPTRADEPTLYVVGGSTVSVSRSRFVNNHNTRAIFNDGRLLLRQSLVADNFGGGVDINYRAETTRLTSVTIAGNAAWGIAIGWQNKSLNLANSIIAGNNFHQQIYTDSGGVFAADTLIQGETHDFPGNQNWDPLFTDAAAGDYTLSPRSPAINAGGASAVETGETDLAGNPRIRSGAPDLGAYESASAPNPLYRSALPVSLTTTRGVDVAFSLTGLGSYGYTWEYFTGTGWVAITDSMVGPGGAVFRITKVGGKSTLTLPSPPLAANGIKVRVTIDGQGVTSDPITVTVLEPETIHVDGSVATSGDGKTWATAYKTLAEVTTARSSSDPAEMIKRISQSRRIIHIAAGTYDAPASGFEFDQRVEVYGGFPAGGSSFAARDAVANRVILSGWIGDSGTTEDNPAAVILIDATNFAIGSDTVFDGLSIEGGKSGIRVRSNARPLFRNLVVSNNAGTGISFDNAGGRVENSRFTGNSSSSHGGGALANDSAVTFSGCAFSGNSAQGSGGGVFIEDGSVRLENCIVSGNESVGEGGGVVVSSGSHFIVNGTVVGNYCSGTSSGGGGGGLFVYQGNLAVWNTIVWANRSDQSTRNPLLPDSIEVQQMNRYPFGAGFNVQASNIESLSQYASAGANIGEDPLFFSGIVAESAPTTAGDFHIYSGSPVTDKGNPDLMGVLPTDADGAPRSVRTVDIGAYELQGTAISLQPADLVYSAGGANEYHVGLIETNAGDVYQWETSSTGSVFTPLTDGAAYTGSGTATLHLLTADPTQHGHVFRVKITSADGGVATSRSASLTVYPDHYHVNAAAADDSGDGYTWATAFKTIGTALAKVRPHPTDGIRIWVADGTYQPSATDAAVSFPLKSNLALYGGFAGNETTLAARDSSAGRTILKGIAGSGAVFTSSGDTVTGARIDGFAINTAATGIKLGTNVSLTVANCSFTGLETGINSILDSVIVEHCRFSGLVLHGIYGTFSSLSVEDSVFEGNQQGIVNVSGGLNVTRSVFRGNGSLVLDGGGIVSNLGSATIDSSLFSGNMSRYGAGVYSQSGHTKVRNSTFAGNSSGLMRVYANGSHGTLEVHNSILWGNGDGSQGAQIFYDVKVAGDDFVANNVQGVVLSYSDFIPTNGNGNTSVDPLFTSPAAFSGTASTAGDYRLSPSSPLINKGANARRGASTTDLAGNPRTFDTTVDMGAYEFQGIQLVITSQPADAVAGVGRGGVFTVATNHPEDAGYQWQVNLDGIWTDVSASADHSGVTTAILTVAGNPAYDGRLYRAHVTTPDAGEAFSNAASYRYASVAVTPPSGVRNATLTGATSSISFNVAGGALPASIVDGSFAVHGMQTGRLSLVDGSLTGLTVNGSTVSMQSTVPFKPGELVEVTTTGSVQRADSFYSVPLVYQFRAGNRGSYGVFPVPTAIPGAPATARALASGDLNGSGSIDLVVGGTSGATVWLNGGAADFTAGQTLGSGTVSQVLLGSLGMTGTTGSKNKLDVILRKSTGEVEIWRNEGDGTFTKSTTISDVAATSLAIADLNGDGSLDLFIATAGADQVWFNNGAGAFTDSTQRLGTGAGLSVAVGDFNNDNSLDVATANGSASIELWNNNGAGRFSARQPSFGESVNRVIASDVDRDGLLDIVGVLTSGSLRVFKQRETAAFNFTGLPASIFGGSPDALNVSDVDGDGFPDIIATASTGSAMRLWKGQGFERSVDRMNFQQVTDQPAFPLTKATDLADLNGDGMMDLITIDAAGSPTVSLYMTGGAPAAPSRLTVTSTTEASIGLSWNDNATTETGYTVERSLFINSSWGVVATLPANTTAYTDGGLNSSTRYYYRVRSNVGGIFQSAYSDTIYGTTNAPAPDISISRLNGPELPRGGVLDFGSVVPGAKSVVTISIGNVGTANLASLSLLLVNGEYYDFAVSKLSTTTVGVNQTTTFTVTFNAWTIGQRTTDLRIYSNDPDESPYTLSLRGASNHAPTFGGYSVTVPHDTTVPLSLDKILASASDEDGNPLTFTSPANTVNGGMLTRTATAITYTPPAGFTGEDRFPITISDSYGASVTGTVTLNVAAPVGDGPLAGNMNPPKLTVAAGGAINLDFQGIPNRAYDIERSVNLGAWEVIATRTASNIGKISFTDASPPPGSGFYRIRKH